MADATYLPKVYIKQGGDELIVASGGKINVETGGLVQANGTQASAITALTDSTGGTPATTFAEITAPGANATTSLTADMTAVKNALAQVVATMNAINTAIKNAGITA